MHLLLIGYVVLDRTVTTVTILVQQAKKLLVLLNASRPFERAQSTTDRLHMCRRLRMKFVPLGSTLLLQTWNRKPGVSVLVLLQNFRIQRSNALKCTSKLW